MRFLVLVNPSSHGGRAGRQWKEIAKVLPSAEFVLLKGIDEAKVLARNASGFEAVVAYGGDGTVNAVADGVMANPDGTLKFGVLYQGTSPDFCRFHGIPTDTEAAMRTLLAGTTRKIPVLQANGHCFFCSCNIGMGAEVASLANRIRPLLGDRIGTFTALMRSILFCRRYCISIDGEEMADCSHLLFSRMPYIAGGIRICLPELKEDEFALWYVRHLSFWGWLKLIPKIYSGKPCGKTRICKGKVTVASTKRVDVEFDGDPHGELPVTISLAERKLKLIVPQFQEVFNA